MRRVTIRLVAVNVALGGLILAGVGVATADSGYSTGGERSAPAAAEPICPSSDIDLAHGCILGVGRLFK